ncbi:unnamed protein product [Sphagnum balticum]
MSAGATLPAAASLRIVPSTTCKAPLEQEQFSSSAAQSFSAFSLTIFGKLQALEKEDDDSSRELLDSSNSSTTTQLMSY